jgi:hypothetical protein
MNADGFGYAADIAVAILDHAGAADSAASSHRSTPSGMVASLSNR